MSLVALSFYLGNGLRAQDRKLVIGVEAACMNYMSPVDDLETFITDLNLRFKNSRVIFVERNDIQSADYLLNIKYKKDIQGGYSQFQYVPQQKTRYEDLPRPPGYAWREFTWEERQKATETRSPGTTLVPYSVPMLTRPGDNLPLPLQAIPANLQQDDSPIREMEYVQLHFMLIKASDQHVIWSQKKKTNKFIDLYTSMVNALRVQINQL